MAETILIDKSAPKEIKYEQLLPQIEALIGDDADETAVLANVAAAIHAAFGFLWTGFYLVKGKELVLGPFQGPVACMRIADGKGVCGTAWSKNKTIVVPNVEQFPGHIACSSDSKSEIVIPLRDRQDDVRGVLDIDSQVLNSFDHTDSRYLENLCAYIGERIY